MQIAMLLNSECDIELLRFQLRFHSDVGIAKFLIWSDSKSQTDFSHAIESRASAIRGLLPDSCEVRYCELPQSVTDENQRLVWLSEYCLSEGYADWVVDNNGADFWLADGDLTEQLDELERGAIDATVRGHLFEVQMMVNEPDSAMQATELPIGFNAYDLPAHDMPAHDLYALLGSAIYQVPSGCYSLGGDIDKLGDKSGAVHRKISHNRSLIEAVDSADQSLSTEVLPVAQSSTISVLHYPQLMAHLQHIKQRGVPEISDHSVFTKPMVAESANVRLNPCMRLYCSMNRFEDQQDAQTAA